MDPTESTEATRTDRTDPLGELQAILLAIRNEPSIQKIERMLCEVLRRVAGAEVVSLFLLDGGGRPRCRATTDPSVRHVGSILCLREEELLELCGPEPYWIADRELVLETDEAQHVLAPASVAVVPLVVFSTLRGLMLFEMGCPDRTGCVASTVIASLLDTIVPIVGIISERDRLERKTEALELLYTVSNELSQVKSEEELLDKIMTLIERRMRVDRCSLMIIDPDRKFLRIKRAFGLTEIRPEKVKVAVGDGIAGSVAATGKPLMIRDIERETHLTRRSSGIQYRTNSLLSVPLVAQGEVIGVINVNNKKDGHPFSDDDLGVLSAIGSEVAANLQRSYMEAQLRRARELDREISRTMV
ncbi:MAG: GAF domain-containing protein [Deltaproteobacteria bacterium]|nr:GAF domain-containing protein [Deltaproteobacteria bacterium]